LFIIFGFGHKTVKSYGSISNQNCDNCHNAINKEMLKVTTWFTLFFIPVMPYRTEYMLVCPICNYAMKISKVDFEMILNGEMQNIQTSTAIGQSVNPQQSPAQPIQQNKYAGKTETQIEYLKQMEEIERQRTSQQES
jgi:hypothetical protein